MISFNNVMSFFQDQKIQENRLMAVIIACINLESRQSKNSNKTKKHGQFVIQ